MKFIYTVHLINKRKSVTHINKQKQVVIKNNFHKLKKKMCDKKNIDIQLRIKSERYIKYVSQKSHINNTNKLCRFLKEDVDLSKLKEECMEDKDYREDIIEKFEETIRSGKYLANQYTRYYGTKRIMASDKKKSNKGKIELVVRMNKETTKPELIMIIHNEFIVKWSKHGFADIKIMSKHMNRLESQTILFNNQRDLCNVFVKINRFCKDYNIYKEYDKNTNNNNQFTAQLLDHLEIKVDEGIKNYMEYILKGTALKLEDKNCLMSYDIYYSYMNTDIFKKYKKDKEEFESIKKGIMESEGENYRWLRIIDDEIEKHDAEEEIVGKIIKGMSNEEEFYEDLTNMVIFLIKNSSSYQDMNMTTCNRFISNLIVWLMSNESYYMNKISQVSRELMYNSMMKLMASVSWDRYSQLIILHSENTRELIDNIKNDIMID